MHVPPQPSGAPHPLAPQAGVHAPEPPTFGPEAPHGKPSAHPPRASVSPQWPVGLRHRPRQSASLSGTHDVPSLEGIPPPSVVGVGTVPLLAPSTAASGSEGIST